MHTSQPNRTFERWEQEARDAWTTSRIENDCEGCESIYYADGEAWRPAQDCPVHGAHPETWRRDLNRELDARWPGTWHNAT